MLRRLLLKFAGRIAARPVRRHLAAFHAATHDPAAVQADLLQSILRSQADTGFGRDHKFAGITTIDEYRRCIPVKSYEYLAPYVERVMRGETSALLADPQILMFALTSGTTASRKHIPITRAYLDDYRRGWNIWGLTAMDRHKAIAMKPVMQLVGDPEEYRTEAGIPCGNLSGYTAQVQKRIIRFLYSVPAVAGKVKDSPTRYQLALRFSIVRKVGLLSSANPSTLVSLARILDQRKETLIRDIYDGTLTLKSPDGADPLPSEVMAKLRRKLKPNPERARQLEEYVKRDGALLPSAVWPVGTMLIGCWTGGSVGPYLRQLKRYYADTPVRDIGLLASEGRMTIPLEDATPAGVLDITSHYFEFIPEGEIDSAQPTVLGAHELQEGGSYFILPTTRSGLYRYHIVDLVRCVGYYNRTPLIEFLGKGNRFANLTGEKLSEYHVTRAVDSAAHRVPQPITAYA